MPAAGIACVGLLLAGLGCDSARQFGDAVRSAAGDAYADRGFRLYQEGKYDESLQQLQQALQQGVKRYSLEEVHTGIGNTLNELGRLDEAVKAHEKALQINPRFHKAWVNLGIVYRLQSKFDDAERCYMKALELKPDYAELHASLGALLIFQDKSKEAILALEKAIALDPQLAVSHANLALALATVGRFDEAEQSLQRAVIRGYRNSAILKKRIANLRALKTSE